MKRFRVHVLAVGCVVGVMLPVRAMASPVAPSATVAVCGAVPAGFARCLAEMQGGAGSIGAAGTAAPAGLSPKAIKSVYDFPTSPQLGLGQTIAIVSAFDAPTLESDLAVFDQQFGLPDCTTANGCFTKVNGAGGTTPPATDPGWSVESHLDVEWAHAIAPGAKILLVEAFTNSAADLFQAEDYAKVHGLYVSNSWVLTEVSLEGAFEHHFSQAEAPGVSFFFGSGDTGAPGYFYPAMSPQVVAVGGTTLHFKAHGKLKSEAGWSGSGGGCSQFMTASAAQAALPDYQTVGCAGRRATPDLSLEADPASGVAVYDTQPINGHSGWLVLGGTSLSTPLIAARAAGTGQLVDQSYVYGANILFRDIRRGNNGFPCTPGYDLVTGRGSWTE